MIFFYKNLIDKKVKSFLENANIYIFSNLYLLQIRGVCNKLQV